MSARIELPVPPAVPWSRQLRRCLAAPRARPASGTTQFVVFAQGRTGSTLLVDLLHSLPRVHCDGEILAAPVRLPRAWIAGHRRRHADVSYGFKVKIYQLTHAQHVADVGAWMRGRHRDGWQVVYLYRRNHLRHALSNVTATRTGEYVVRGDRAARDRRVPVDVDVLLEAMRLRREQAALEWQALEGVPHVAVCYEDDLADSGRHPDTVARLAHHLGLPEAPPHTDIRRINAGALAELVLNVDEVERRLRGTEWERYLD